MDSGNIVKISNIKRERESVKLRKEILKNAFIKSIPIMFSYLFVSMAYGIMMEEAGFA